MSYNCEGASQWLGVLPLTECGFSFHKGAFQDALALCYRWTPRHVASQFACGKRFTVEHTFSYPYGGFSLLRYDIRDTTASFFSEVCHNVALDPSFTTLSQTLEKGSREPTLRMVSVSVMQAEELRPHWWLRWLKLRVRA